MDSKFLTLCIKNTTDTEERPIHCTINNTSLLLIPDQEVSIPISKSSSLDLSLNGQKYSLPDLLKSTDSFERWIKLKNSSKFLLSGILSSMNEDLSFEKEEKCKYLKALTRSEVQIKRTEECLGQLNQQMGPIFHKILNDQKKIPLTCPDKPRNTQIHSPSKGKTPKLSRSNSSLSLASLSDCYVELPSSKTIGLENLASNDLPILVSATIGTLAKNSLYKYCGSLINHIENMGCASLNSLKAFKLIEEQKCLKLNEIITTKENILTEFSANNEDVVREIRANSQTKMKLRLLLKDTEHDHTNASGFLDHIKDLEQNFCEAFDERQNLASFFICEMNEFADKFQALTDFSNEIACDKRQLGKELQKENAKFDLFTDEVRLLKNELIKLEGKIFLESFESYKHETVNNALSKNIESKERLRSELYESLVHYKNNLRNSEYIIKILEKDCYNMKLMISQNKSELKDYQELLQNIAAELSYTSTNLPDTKNYMKKLKHSELKCKKLYKSLNSDSLNLMKLELDYLSDLTLKWTSESINESRIFGHLSNIYEQREYEYDVTEEATLQIKHENPIYNPDTNDKIDLALGAFLNERDKSLDIPFQRIHHGLYLFGTKKYLMKLERNKLQVKVGGGFLPINQFLDEYQTAERDKLEQRNYQFTPEAKRFMGKWAECIIDSNETSPERMKEQLQNAEHAHRRTTCFAIKLKGMTRRSLSSITVTNRKNLLGNSL